MEENKRCFISIELPKEAVNEIKRIQGLIKNKNMFIGKFTEPENLHLTLKFLGEIDKFKIEDVKNKLKKVRLNVFDSWLEDAGVFSKRVIKIVWVGLKGRVFELQKQIDEALKDMFEQESKFMSHITIARVKHVYNKKEFISYLEGIRLKRIKFKIESFYLKESELFPEGPVYTEIKKYKLES